MNALDRAALWRSTVPRLTVLPALEAGLALVCLLLFSQALLGPLLADPASSDAGEALRLIWPPVYLITLVLIAVRPARFAALALRSWPLIALAGLVTASTLWSIDPEVTARRALAAVFTMAFAIWFAARFSWRDMVRLIAITLGVVMVGSALASLLFPGFGVHQSVHAGAWRGLWWEKNTLGSMMTWAVLAFLAAAALDPARRRLWCALAVPAFALVLASTSRTALLGVMIALAGPAMIALARRGFGFAAAGLIAGAVGVALLGLILVIGPETLLDALGREATLTGRTDIWVVLIEQIRERPWGGYGYGAYWSTEEGPAFWVRQATGWPVPTAHNAWLESALAIGVPGAALALGVHLAGIGHGLGRLFSGRETYWVLPFFVIYAIIALSESNYLGQNSLAWVMFCATAAKLAGGERARPGQV